jgi:DNA replication protein DnaC
LWGDASAYRELQRFIAPDLVVIDDLGLRKLSGQASSDFYDLVVERHTRASCARYVLPTPTGPLKAIFSCRSNGQKDVYFDFDQEARASSLRDIDLQLTA